ncbi:MAG: GldG family protein [Bdellovibrionaceae bacterium]|nr:GldG family protein [Pseudobdellovibrionaceae bacterium]
MSQLGKLLLLGALLSLISFIVFLALLQAWVPFHWVAIFFMVTFTGGAIYLDRKFYSEFFSMKTTKQGLSMGTLILLVVCILSAVNFVGARRYLTLDLSAAKVNSLSEQSLKILDTMKDDLKVIYFYNTGMEGVETNRKQFVDLIRKYQDHSPRIQLDFVDVNTRPDLTEKYQIKQGTQAVLMEYQGRTSLIEKIDEQEITGGLVKVSRATAKKILVVSGHGELPLDSAPGGDSASFMKSLLEGNRYDVGTFTFAEAGQVPADADVVMILGPKQQFLESEVQALEAYLEGGGGVLLALEPHQATGLEPLLNRVGIKTANNFVRTTIKLPIGETTDPRFTRGSVFSPTNPITRPFGQNQFTVFRFPQSIERVGTNPPEGLQIDDLVRTDASSFAVTNLQATQKSADGPFTVAMGIKGKMPGAADAKEFQMVVIGDREFVNDQSLYQNLNRDLLLNAVASLAREEHIISISPKEVGRTELVLLDTSFVLYIFLFAIPLPLALYAGSFVMWWRRRSA